MLPDKQTKTNIGVGMGVLLQLTGVFLARTGDAAAILGCAVLILISIPVFIWGCMNYAEGKGHSKWVGLVGLAGIIGLIVLIVMPDQDQDGLVPRLQIVKFVSLISMLVGFGLALLGVWMHELGDDVRLERLLHPWPGVCMLLGAFIVGVSLLLMVRDGRR